jgi:methylthioribose-1-phosphate isomerase
MGRQAPRATTARCFRHNDHLIDPTKAIAMTTAPTPTLVRDSVILERGRVRVLDRRTFPHRIEFVDCADVETCARAIEDMVTQSAGPGKLAGAAMVLAAEACADQRPEQRMTAMSVAGRRLLKTRPTNNNIREIVNVVNIALNNIVASENFVDDVERLVRREWEIRDKNSRRLGTFAASLIEDGDAILTHCWAETSLIDTLTVAVESGKKITVICTETRPYLQGARLTAHSVAEMGLPVTVITDGMAAHAMASGLVSRYMTAADRVTLSGHVFNKVGTFQIAIAAAALEVPYIAMVLRADRLASVPDAVELEMRNGDESLYCMGHRTASPLAKGWYPAFDITPPRFVSAYATQEGVFRAEELASRFG